jgi:poly(A) polymerase
VLSKVASLLTAAGDGLRCILQGAAKWDTLFQPFPFFTQYKNYIMVEVGGATEEAHVKWEGWVQSRLRFLMSNIQTYTMGNLLLHPWPFEITDKATPHTSYFFLGLHRRPQVDHLLQLAQFFDH